MDDVVAQAATPEAAAPEAAATAQEAPTTSVEDAEPVTQVAEGSEQSENAGEEGETVEGDPEPLKITLPEGVGEGYQEQADKFAGALSEFLKGKPSASPNEIAQMAAEWQVKEAEDDTNKAVAEVKRWEAEARADPELGGADFDKNVGYAVKALDAYGSPELVGILDSTGLGNHKAVISALMKMGKEIKDADVEPTGGSVSVKNATAARYPNS